MKRRNCKHLWRERKRERERERERAGERERERGHFLSNWLKRTKNKKRKTLQIFYWKSKCNIWFTLIQWNTVSSSFKIVKYLISIKNVVCCILCTTMKWKVKEFFWKMTLYFGEFGKAKRFFYFQNIYIYNLTMCLSIRAYFVTDGKVTQFSVKDRYTYYQMVRIHSLNLGNMEYLFISITLRSTLVLIGSTC